MTPFERVVDYISDFDPHFRDGIAGAAPEQIAELEALLGGPLPPTYRDFLRVMGAGMDWIAIRRLDLHIETVLDYYRRENWLPRNRYIRIGVDRGDPPLHPHLEIERPEDDPEVVCFPPCRPHELATVLATSLEPLAGSLVELVAMPAFRMFEISPDGAIPPDLRTARWRRGAIEEAEAALLGAGCEKLWFSSRSGRAYRRQGNAVLASQLVGYPLQILVSPPTGPRTDGLLSALLRAVPELVRIR